MPYARGYPPRALVFFDNDSVVFANAGAGVAAEAFFFVHGVGLIAVHFPNGNGADVNTLAAANALISVKNNLVAHNSLQMLDRMNPVLLIKSELADVCLHIRCLLS
jgi:hypothetical protein